MAVDGKRDYGLIQVEEVEVLSAPGSGACEFR